MKRLFASICILGLLLGTSCSDPNEDVFHNIDQEAKIANTTGGDDTGGQHENPPPGGN